MYTDLVSEKWKLTVYCVLLVRACYLEIYKHSRQKNVFAALWNLVGDFGTLKEFYGSADAHSRQWISSLTCTLTFLRYHLPWWQKVLSLFSTQLCKCQNDCINQATFIVEMVNSEHDPRVKSVPAWAVSHMPEAQWSSRLARPQRADCTRRKPRLLNLPKKKKKKNL